MRIFYYLLPVMVGIAMAVQSGINSQLRIAIRDPLFAAFISFFSGTIALVIILLFSRQSLPEWSALSSVNWYKLTGGILGVFVVTVTLLSVQQIGASNMFVLIISGQLVTAVIMDHFGLLGMRTSTLSLQKIAGILLLIAGAWLVNKD